MGPKIPEQKDPKSPAGSISVSPLSARVTATQPLPRQAFNSSQRDSLGSAMASAAGRSGGATGGRYDPKTVMGLLQSGGRGY